MTPDYTDRELYDARQKHESMRAAGRALGIPESTIRQRLKDYCADIPDHAFVPDPEVLSATHTSHAETRDRSQPGVVKRFILTSAQNNVQVHEMFMKNLRVFAKHMGAELLISYTLYDKTGYRGVVRKGEAVHQRQDVWWDKATEPYASNERTLLHRRLTFCGELDILASVSRPLSGLESYCGRSSIIIPHNRFAFQCVASRRHQMPKEMYTTGSVTLPRFVQRKTGQLAEFHHVLGALLVEITEEGFFHVHHLNADDDGRFFWLDKMVNQGEVIYHHRGAAGLILGDLHSEKGDEETLEATVELIKELAPEAVVVHDVLDFESRNHHTIKDPFFQTQMLYEQRSVGRDIRLAAECLKKIRRSTGLEVVVAASNHDDALLRWLKETDWRTDPENAPTYLRLALAMVCETRIGVASKDLRPVHTALLTLGNLYGEDCRFLMPDESFEIEGIECGMHGHVGPSGTRGSPANLSKLGFKTFTGHTHTPSIVDGCYTVGVTGKLDMGYNKGPSKWMHTHGIIYPNGKRAFLTLKGGKWRA